MAMSSDQNPDVLENGAEIIKRFGGIRPMAAKIEAPVTTVQGWKKRNTIPAQRRDMILETAEKLNIDLSDLIPGLETIREQDNQAQPKDNGTETKTEAETNTNTETDTGTDTGTENKNEVSMSPQDDTSNDMLPETLPDSLKPIPKITDSDNDPDPQQANSDLTAREDISVNITGPMRRRSKQEEIRPISSRIADVSTPKTDHDLSTQIGHPKDGISSSNTSSGDLSGNNPSGTSGTAPTAQGFITMKELEQRLTQMRRRIYARIYWTSAFVAILVFVMAVILLWPQANTVKTMSEQNNQRLVALEKGVSGLDQDIQEMQGKRGSFFGDLLPEGTSAKDILPQGVMRRIESLGAETREIREQIGDLAQDTQKLAGELTSPNGGSVTQRLQILEKKFQQFTSSGELNTTFGFLLGRVERYKSSPAGQAQLAAALGQLDALLQGQENWDAATIQTSLSTIRGQDNALGQALDGVEDKNLQAAALLLTFTQIRASFGRDRASFEDDLVILRSLVHKDDTDLKLALEKLAPKAKTGILTPGGLSKELRALSGDIVISSLKGEDIKIQDAAKDRLAKILETGNADPAEGELNITQNRIIRAHALLDEGRIQEAIAELQALEGDSNKTAQPFIEEAQSALLAGQVQSLLGDSLVTKLRGGLSGVGGTSSTATIGGGGNHAALFNTLKRELYRVTSPGVIVDEESGFAILPR